MIKLEINSPISYTGDLLKSIVCENYPLKIEEIKSVEIIKRSLEVKDKGNIHYKMTLALTLPFEKEEGMLKMRKRVSEYGGYKYPSLVSRLKSRPYIIGSGPAGLFAALTLAEAGARPIILERGMQVDERIKKIELFNSLGILDPECNVQFGEGGAGTYSDGKLKVGKMDCLKNKILSEFVLAGANGEIMFSTSAHLGTDRLPGIVKGIREKIISLGGEFRFGARLTDITVEGGEVVGIEYIHNGQKINEPAEILFLAVGHSARDVFRVLLSLGVKMEAKPFGIGARIEHPREYTNTLIYGKDYPKELESASYHLVTHLKNGRSVYSFCMCPGGTVVPASSNEGMVVTNGMSEFSRDGDNSNSAILVSVSPEDFGNEALDGFVFQERLERTAFGAFGDYTAPAIRLDDFMKDSSPSDFGSVIPSYARGVNKSKLGNFLPNFVLDSMKAGFLDFDSWLSGFYLPDATLTGVETRSTSPVRILRGEDFQSPNIKGLFPIGEGAGYSGGIISSAYDGMRAAISVLDEDRI